jgi:hypothetical protein
MKTIQPIVIWSLGQVKQGTLLNAYVVADNLKDSATFYFAIQSDTEVLSQGNLTMTGEDYDGFVSNDYAYNWIAGKLGVVITGDYVPAETVETV